ncbi:hypothetical protein HDV05_006476, partial [Chytridiales sp. JEL 0842]
MEAELERWRQTSQLKHVGPLPTVRKPQKKCVKHPDYLRKIDEPTDTSHRSGANSREKPFVEGLLEKMHKEVAALTFSKDVTK